MLRARNDLKKISLPFKNTDTLINEYGKHIDYIAVYGNGSEKFNLQNFSKKYKILENQKKLKKKRKKKKNVIGVST